MSVSASSPRLSPPPRLSPSPRVSSPSNVHVNHDVDDNDDIDDDYEPYNSEEERAVSSLIANYNIARKK